MASNFPEVVAADVEGFARAWDCGGIKMILDATSKKFAVDFANTVLRSYVIELRAKAALALKAKQAAAAGQVNPAVPAQVDAVATTPVQPSTPQKSSIILTDC